MGFSPLTSRAVGLSAKKWGNMFFTDIMFSTKIFFSLYDNFVFAIYLQYQTAAMKSFKMMAKSQSQ